MAYSINQIEEIKAQAIKNNKNLVFLYLEILNSSTITSTVAIYKNVPAEILVNVATTSYPDELTIHPMPIPIGFITNLYYITSLNQNHYCSCFFINPS